jgi:hypothetical protein
MVRGRPPTKHLKLIARLKYERKLYQEQDLTQLLDRLKALRREAVDKAR